jgi:hypothetical protein
MEARFNTEVDKVHLRIDPLHKKADFMKFEKYARDTFAVNVDVKNIRKDLNESVD